MNFDSSVSFEVEESHFNRVTTYFLIGRLNSNCPRLNQNEKLEITNVSANQTSGRPRSRGSR